VRAVLALLVLLPLAGCGDDDAPTEARPQGDASIGGQVVSMVDGVPITVDEVESAARRYDLSPREALGKLQDRELLAAAAARAGHGDDPYVRRVTRQAAVQALLAREVEGEVPVPPEAIERRIEESRDRFDHPERRGSHHVLVKLPEEPTEDQLQVARSFAREVTDLFREAADPVAVVRSHASTSEVEGLEVVAEAVGPMARDAAAAEPYLAAIFALDEPGVVPDPVRTEFGVHAVHLSAIEPARTFDREEAERVVREEIVAEAHRRRLAELVQRLEQRYRPRVREEVVRRVLARDPTAWGAP